MDDARTRAYQTLAVPNPNLPLRESEVGYIELVSSPDPRIEPMIFALEHHRVRVGRFSTAGTYATSSDVYVAISDEATAIAPMNTMFEYIYGEFHAFDTRSAHGTYVNGEQILKRRVLRPGDVIDVGGIPDDAGVLRGHARIVFLGHTPPPGRPIRRAPSRTQFTWHSPRSSATVEIDAATGSARASFDIYDDHAHDDTLAGALRIAAPPQLPTPTLDGDEIVYHVGEPLTWLPANWLVEPRRACTLVADLCDALASQPGVLGPFERGLVWQRPGGGAVLFAAGLSRSAYLWDHNLRGATLQALHLRASPEELLGRGTGPATNVFYAAYLLVELVAGREPFRGRDLDYLKAVRDGHVDLPDNLPPIHAAFSPDPAARPLMVELAALLR
jgi:hypothetical protein